MQELDLFDMHCHTATESGGIWYPDGRDLLPCWAAAVLLRLCSQQTGSDGDSDSTFCALSWVLQPLQESALVGETTTVQAQVLGPPYPQRWNRSNFASTYP